MHWLAQRLEAIHGLADRYLRLRTAPTTPGLDIATRKARAEFHQGMQTLVEEVNVRQGVTAAFASHEGLILAVAGEHSAKDQEAWAAMAQVSLLYSQKTAQTLSLGEAQQIVIVGKEGKLVLFPVGTMVLGVLSPTQTNLSQALAA